MPSSNIDKNTRTAPSKARWVSSAGPYIVGIILALVIGYFFDQSHIGSSADATGTTSTKSTYDFSAPISAPTRITCRGSVVEITKPAVDYSSFLADRKRITVYLDNQASAILERFAALRDYFSQNKTWIGYSLERLKIQSDIDEIIEKDSEAIKRFLGNLSMAQYPSGFGIVAHSIAHLDLAKLHVKVYAYSTLLEVPKIRKVIPDFFEDVSSIVVVRATDFNDCVYIVFRYTQDATHVFLDVLYGTEEDDIEWTDAEGTSGYGRVCNSGTEAVYCPLSVSRASKWKADVGSWTEQGRMSP